MYIVEYKSTKSIVHISTHHHFPSPHVVHKKEDQITKLAQKKLGKEVEWGVAATTKTHDLFRNVVK